MMKAFVFPGQGCQKEGMGKDLYEHFPKAKVVFEQANDILGERFSDFLFSATEDVLMDTRYTQLGIFIYEVALDVFCQIPTFTATFAEKCFYARGCSR